MRHWNLLRPASRMASRLGAGLKGRGREDIMAHSDVDDIVRRYDGAHNPIGIAYDRSGFISLIGDGFDIEETYFHFFPARAMPISLPGIAHRALDRWMPFMIYANLRRR